MQARKYLFTAWPVFVLVRNGRPRVACIGRCRWEPFWGLTLLASYIGRKEALLPAVL